MAHFAEINSNNKVLRVVVVNNNELLVNGVENEQKGIDFCKSLFGSNTNWVQTSYNSKFRKQYAGIGHTYDSIKNKFIAAQPYPSWLLDENDDWQAPLPQPSITEEQKLNNQFYSWDEVNQSWVLVSLIDGVKVPVSLDNN
jgi:hypothetical protein